MAFFMEYDETYIAGQHKASSISSTDSGDHPPSLYTGHADSCSSLCDPDELREPLPVFEDPSPFEPVKFNQRNSICIPFEDEMIPSSFGSSLTIPVTDKPRVPHDEDNKLVLDPISKNLSPTSSSPPTPAPPLSKDEKRVNHIASEQKRRQNIRSGFHQLTDLIPALKSMPHSKSNILFKTADYIKHTEKRNKALQQRLQQLQRRVALSTNAISAATPQYASPPSSSSRYTSTQQQIRRLQHQLLKQQELLVQHNIPHQPLHHAIVMPEDNSPPPPPPASYIPCLHIPADTEFGQESMVRERLLSCGKLKLNRPL